MIKIENLYVTQYYVDRIEQIPSIIQSIQNGEYINPIMISEIPGSYVNYRIEDGTHRAVAYVLSGRDELKYGEYQLVPFNNSRKTTNSLINFVDELK